MTLRTDGPVIPTEEPSFHVAAQGFPGRPEFLLWQDPGPRRRRKKVTVVTSVHCVWGEEDKCTEHPEVSEGILDFSRRKGSKKNKTMFKLWMQMLPIEIIEARGRGTEETNPRAQLAAS